MLQIAASGPGSPTIKSLFVRQINTHLTDALVKAIGCRGLALMACQCGGDECGANTIPRLMMPISYCLFVSLWNHIFPFYINQQKQTLHIRAPTELKPLRLIGEMRE